VSFEYRGKVALVTGASSGIGRAVALELAARGATVAGVARRAGLLEEVAELCRCSAPASLPVEADLTEPGEAARAVAEVTARAGPIDVLVNSAGASMRVHATRLTLEQVERSLAVNYLAAVRATLAVLPSMLDRRTGHLVSVGSVAGRVGSPREAAYSGAKFALTGFTESLAADLSGTGVRAHLVHPGPVDTPIWDHLDEPASWRGRFRRPEEVAAAVCRCLERGSFERWVPRPMGLVPLVRAAFPRPYLEAAGLFDRWSTGAGARRRTPRAARGSGESTGT
jgi:NAD(P)-dependent dehydrogenase (short-subunit alcohol dehydrogenase family)